MKSKSGSVTTYPENIKCIFQTKHKKGNLKQKKNAKYKNNIKDYAVNSEQLSIGRVLEPTETRPKYYYNRENYDLDCFGGSMKTDLNSVKFVIFSEEEKIYI